MRARDGELVQESPWHQPANNNSSSACVGLARASIGASSVKRRHGVDFPRGGMQGESMSAESATMDYPQQPPTAPRTLPRPPLRHLDTLCFAARTSSAYA